MGTCSATQVVMAHGYFCGRGSRGGWWCVRQRTGCCGWHVSRMEPQSSHANTCSHTAQQPAPQPTAASLNHGQGGQMEAAGIPSNHAHHGRGATQPQQQPALDAKQRILALDCALYSCFATPACIRHAQTWCVQHPQDHLGRDCLYGHSCCHHSRQDDCRHTPCKTLIAVPHQHHQQLEQSAHTQSFNTPRWGLAPLPLRLPTCPPAHLW